MPWENFSGRVPGTNDLTVLLTIMLFNMTTRDDPQVVLVNLILWWARTCSRTVNQSLDLVLVWNCCLALQKLTTPISKWSLEQSF